MSKRLVSTSKLTAIGDAIRAKTGETGLLTLDQMVASIESLKGSIDPASIYVNALNTAASSRSLSVFSWIDLLVIAQSIEQNGEESSVYSAAVACAEAGAYKETTFDGTTVYATMVGVLQALADKNGKKRGLQFACTAGIPTTANLLGDAGGVTAARMNSSNTNTGGWGASAMRDSMSASDSGIASKFADDLKSVIQPTCVPYGSAYNGTSGDVEYSTDFMWLMSYIEAYGTITSSYGSSFDMNTYKHLANEGEQMMWFKKNNVSASNYGSMAQGATACWLRSCHSSSSGYFGTINKDYGNGSPGYNNATLNYSVIPCFSL